MRLIYNFSLQCTCCCRRFCHFQIFPGHVRRGRPFLRVGEVPAVAHRSRSNRDNVIVTSSSESEMTSPQANYRGDYNKRKPLADTTNRGRQEAIKETSNVKGRNCWLHTINYKFKLISRCIDNSYFNINVASTCLTTQQFTPSNKNTKEKPIERALKDSSAAPPLPPAAKRKRTSSPAPPPPPRKNQTLLPPNRKMSRAQDNIEPVDFDAGGGDETQVADDVEERNGHDRGSQASRSSSTGRNNNG